MTAEPMLSKRPVFNFIFLLKNFLVMRKTRLRSDPLELDTWAGGHVGRWTSGQVDMLACGHVGSWTSGQVDTWAGTSWTFKK